MKKLFFVVLLSPLFMFGQDCKVITETDPYTKETKISSGFISLTGGSLTIEADSKEIDYFFVVDGKCFNDGSTLYVFFENTKAKMTYRSSGSMNCDGYFHVKFRNGASTPSQLQKLAAQKITQLIFVASDKKETVINFLPDTQQLVSRMGTCVIAEAKKLVR